MVTKSTLSAESMVAIVAVICMVVVIALAFRRLRRWGETPSQGVDTILAHARSIGSAVWAAMLIGALIVAIAIVLVS